MTASEIADLRRTFSRHTPLQSPDTPGVVGKEAVQITEDLNKLLPEAAQAKSREVSEKMNLYRQLTDKSPSDVSTPAEKGKLRQKLRNLLLEASPEARDKTKLTDIMEGFDDPTRWGENVPGMKDIAPDLYKRIQEEAACNHKKDKVQSEKCCPGI